MDRSAWSTKQMLHLRRCPSSKEPSPCFKKACLASSSASLRTHAAHRQPLGLVHLPSASPPAPRLSECHSRHTHVGGDVEAPSHVCSHQHVSHVCSHQRAAASRTPAERDGLYARHLQTSSDGPYAYIRAKSAEGRRGRQREAEGRRGPLPSSGR